LNKTTTKRYPWRLMVGTRMIMSLGQGANLAGSVYLGIFIKLPHISHIFDTFII
jgi:hypothetical protein